MLKRLLVNEKIKRVKLKDDCFSSCIEDYKYSKVLESSIKKSCCHDESNQIRFMVGKQNYFRKYSLEKGENPFYKNANSTLEETIIPRLNLNGKEEKQKDSCEKIERKETLQSSGYGTGRLKNSIVHVESRLIIFERKKKLKFKK